MKKSVLITGAGSGIGKATAMKMAELGSSVILMGRREAQLQDVMECLPGDGHAMRAVDIADKKALNKAMQDGLMDKRNLYAVFANAGIGGANEYGEDDRWSQIIDVNLSGAYYTVMESLPFLKKSGFAYGHILFTSSCLARFGVPYHTAYCASKSGLMGLVKAMAVELAEEKILVNAILPGWVDTEMARKSIEAIAESTGRQYKEAFKEQMGFVPLGKMSEADELAALVQFMFSDEQKSITGQCIDINNGSFMI